MTVEFVLVDDEKGEYSDAFMTLEMPMPPRVGEWFNECEQHEHGDFTVKDVSYCVGSEGVISAVVFCEPKVK